MCKLHHVSIATNNFEQYKKLFLMLGATIKREIKKNTTKQLWFYEGIQLKEINSLKFGTDDVDHIALGTKNVEKTIKIALENGCTLNLRGKNWFSLPNGIAIELMEID